MAERYRITGKVLSIKGTCNAGHKVGDEFELGFGKPAGVCGTFFNSIFPRIAVLEFGGQFPWGDPDVVKAECPDRANLVEIEIRRHR